MLPLSADMQLPKRSQDLDPLARSQKRIRLDAMYRLSSDTEATLGEDQDVCTSDDSVRDLPFADPGEMDMDDEIIEGGDDNIQETCYGAVRHT